MAPIDNSVKNSVTKRLLSVSTTWMANIYLPAIYDIITKQTGGGEWAGVLDSSCIPLLQVLFPLHMVQSRVRLETVVPAWPLSEPAPAPAEGLGITRALSDERVVDVEAPAQERRFFRTSLFQGRQTKARYMPLFGTTRESHDEIKAKFDDDLRIWSLGTEAVKEGRPNTFEENKPEDLSAKTRKETVTFATPWCEIEVPNVTDAEAPMGPLFMLSTQLNPDEEFRLDLSAAPNPSLLDVFTPVRQPFDS